MSRLIDMTGGIYGRLTVLYKVDKPENRKTGSFWYCRCECGNTVTVSRSDLVTGKVKSCGCYRKEKTRELTYAHGLCEHRLYHIWKNIKTRCCYKGCRSYKNYGDRGITICNEWKHDFLSFYHWALSNGYDDDLTIERIDVNGNYCPENCTWIPLKEQAKNRTNTVYLNIDDKVYRLCDIESDVKKCNISNRLRLGWSDKDAVTKPLCFERKTCFITAKGETHSAYEWSKITGISLSTIHYRKNAGWHDEDIVSLKPDTHNRVSKE